MRIPASLSFLLLTLQTVAADPLPPGRPNAEGFHRDRLQRVFELVEGTVASGQHAGATVLVARHGKIVGWQTFGSRNLDTGAPMEKDTFFDVPADKLDRVARLHEIKEGKLRTTPEILGTYAEPGRGIPCGGAGLFSTIGDYARFAQCLLNGGQLDGVRILGRKTIELARLNSLPTGVYAFSPADHWGLFSAVRTDVARGGEPISHGTFYWSGAATTHFLVDPEEAIVALVFCQHIPFDQHGLFTRFRTAVMQAVE